MNKYFFYLVILFQFSFTLSAQVYYSNNSLIYAPDYQYHIVGTVKENIIIWKTFLNRHSQAQIFVYDNSMKFVRKVNTAILQSDIDPCLQFFVTGNSFLVFCPYKHQSSFLYKFSRFDERANLILTETLDSLAVKANNVSNETFFYPAVLYPVNEKMKVYYEEQFGPVIPIVPFSQDDEVIRYVVNSNFGQQVSIFGTDSRRVANLMDAFVNQVGRINLNAQAQRGPDSFPFNGRKDSAEGTLSVSDALRVFSIRTLVATKNTDSNKQMISNIIRNRESAFLSTDYIF